MAKSLKSILETYTPRSADEKRFIDKHVVVKHPDRNGNGDELFKASNIKTVKRSLQHGYDAGKDAAVYEEIESQRFDDHYDKQPDHVQNNLNTHLRNGLSYPAAVAKELSRKHGATPLHESNDQIV